MKEYKIECLNLSKQDITAKRTRYLVTFPDNTSFVCTRFDNRSDHVYFSEETQWKIDTELLDEIENDIINKKYLQSTGNLN